MDFIRFFQCILPAARVEGESYYFEVVGSTFLSNGVLQLVFKLKDGSGIEHLLLQEFDVGTLHFEDLVARVYDLELSEARVVDVTASDFLRWNGHCRLCVGFNDMLEVDLKTVEDFELPLSALYDV